MTESLAQEIDAFFSKHRINHSLDEFALNYLGTISGNINEHTKRQQFKKFMMDSANGHDWFIRLENFFRCLLNRKLDTQQANDIVWSCLLKGMLRNFGDGFKNINTQHLMKEYLEEHFGFVFLENTHGTVADGPFILDTRPPKERDPQ